MITLRVELANDVLKEVYLSLRHIISFAASNGHTRILMSNGDVYFADMKPDQLDELILLQQIAFETALPN